MEAGHPDAFLLALANCSSYGAQTLALLHNHFTTSEAAWNATREELLALGIPKGRVETFLNHRLNTDPQTFPDIIARAGILAITQAHPRYPAPLKTIYDPPFVLFVLGKMPNESMPIVAIVGSRAATSYGIENARVFSTGLARAGVSVASGLAYGIDAAAHKGALEGNGHTIAVLASGLLSKKSAEQEMLQKAILDGGGAVISERPLKEPSQSFSFPIRNRIVAGMAKATLVIEAALPSGSLLTAKEAIDNHREIFAIPGPINSKTSAGTNNLIKEGAHMATSPDDILLALQMAPARGAFISYKPKSAIESSLLALLERGPKHVDDLVRESQIARHEAAQTLSMLELEGVVEKDESMTYKRL